MLILMFTIIITVMVMLMLILMLDRPDERPHPCTDIGRDRSARPYSRSDCITSLAYVPRGNPRLVRTEGRHRLGQDTEYRSRYTEPNETAARLW